jgi:hypothetical protein
MSLRLNVSKGALAALLVWACAKAEDSDLVGRPRVPTAGTGGATGGTGGKGGTGGTSGSSAGKGGAAGATGGTAGTGGSGGSAGSGRAGAPACGDSTDAGLVVHYRVDNARDSSDQVFFHLYLENNSDEALDLRRVEIRYWMTAEPTSFDSPVSYFASQAVFLSKRAEYVDDGELSHLLMTFTGEVPSQNADLNGAEVQFTVQAKDNGRFDQSNDYSFAPRLIEKTPHDRITAYVDGKLAWGREPSGRCPGQGEGGQGGQGGEGAEGGEPGTGGTLVGGQGGEGGA